MDYKNGRKVFRNKSNNRKRRIRKFFKVILILIAVGIVAFFAFEIGKPLVEYIKTQSENGKNEVTSSTESVPVTSSETTISFNETVATTTEVAEKTSLSCFTLPTDALQSKSRLSDYLDVVKERGYTSVNFIMKGEGGTTYYKTNSELILSAESEINGTIPAEEIVMECRMREFDVYGTLNALEDNNRYGEYKDGSYINLDGSTWLDNAPSNGGKPWLSPFDTKTLELMEFMTTEIVSAGFDGVILEGLTFPYFRNSDVGHLGEYVVAPDRYKALFDVYNTVRDVTILAEKEFFLKLDADKIIANTEEIFKPAELGEVNLIVEYESGDYNETVVYNKMPIELPTDDEVEKFAKIIEIVDELSGNRIKIIPSIRYSGFSNDDHNEIINSILNTGYDSYINY